MADTSPIKPVWQLYQRHAAAFDGDRSRALFERSYLDAVAGLAGGNRTVLDLGCGAGAPIAQYFVERGWRVTGADAASAMLAIAEARLPEAEWIEADMRSLALGRTFGAVIAWDSFFPLEADEQRAMFAIFAAHAASGAGLLFISGPEAGTAFGDFYGSELFHASLDPAEYSALLAETGFDVVIFRAEDPACGGHTVWLAQKKTDDAAIAPSGPGQSI